MVEFSFSYFCAVGNFSISQNHKRLAFTRFKDYFFGMRYPHFDLFS